MPNNKKKLGECTVGCKNDVLHLLVLISGTTDPVNTFVTPDHRAVSYPSVKKENIAPSQYWDEAFYKDIEALVKTRKNTKLFAFHGWSGDNRQGNREVAGAYLVNRLVGANKETAFYGPSYQKKTIHIHLLGHSHGGNVVNEMTKQIDKLGSRWPATWKVKSFTYLSTPFFQKLHQVKLGSFVHPQAEVLNVYNDYDLTQRMLADFSMFTLSDAIQVQQIIDTLKASLTQLMASFDAVPWGLTTDAWLNQQEGRQLYTAARDFLGSTVARQGFISIIQFLQNIEAIAVGLNKPIEYKASTELLANHQITRSYQLLSDANLANLKQMIAAMTASVKESIQGLNEGLTTNSYSRVGFIKALFRGTTALTNNLATFLNIPAGTPNVRASGVLWQTLVGVLSDAIEVFDDTVTQPNAQFNGARHVNSLDVTSRDAYHGKPQTTSYSKLIAKIEALEKRISAKPDADQLLELLLILLVHNPQVRGMATRFRTWVDWINSAEYAVTGDLDTTLKAARATLTNLANALLNRFEGEIEDPTDTSPSPVVGRRGSLQYLLVESHSTSRRVLHPEVKTFLQKMMG